MRPSASRPRSGSMRPAKSRSPVSAMPPCERRPVCPRSLARRTPSLPDDRRSDHFLPLLGGEIFRLAAGELPAVHRPGPAEAHVEPALAEQPERFLRAVVAGVVVVEEERHFPAAEVFG